MPVEIPLDHEDSRAAWPHCDQTVLHAPGVCEYCDHYPERQRGRIDAKIAFTGEEADPLGVPDPATLRRPIEVINLWHGNVPMTPAQIKADDEYLESFNRYLDYEFSPWWKKLFMRKPKSG